MNHSDTIDQVYNRLKANYGDCDITMFGGVLTVRTPLGEVRADENHHISFYVAGELLDEVDAQGEEFYIEIESFILMIQKDEMRCSSVLINAHEKVRKISSRVINISGVLEAAILVLCLIFKNIWCFAALLAWPVLMMIPLGILRMRSLRENWICPHCGNRLPTEKKSLIPQIKYVSHCPQCGSSLIDEKLAEEFRQEMLADDDSQEFLEDEYEPVKPGGRDVCTASGILFIILTLFSCLLVLATMDKSAVAIAINAVIILIMAAASAALFFCRAPKDKIFESAKITLCERKFVSWVGFSISIVGCIFTWISLIYPADIMSDILVVVIFALLGLFIMLTGIWMMLAGSNRRLYVFSNTITYISSFGRRKDFDISQIGSVKINASKSIRFLDSQGKKLFSVEINMQGVDRILDWIEKRELKTKITNTLEKQLDQIDENVNTVSWKEEYRTGLHNHMKAVKVSKIIAVLLFAAGCILPFAAYLFMDIKMVHTIYLSALAPLPMIIFYLIAAPVLFTDNFPEGATEEWKSMHIKFPTGTVALLSLILAAQFRHFWEGLVLEIVDEMRFYLVVLVIAALLIGLICIRTPKRVRKGDGLFIMGVSMILCSYVMVYGGCLAMASPSYHYPAEILERTDPAGEDDDYTLTIRLDDGSTMEMEVPEYLYDLEESGAEFVVCQKNTPLGIRMVRLHLPEGVKVSDFENNT